MKVLLIGHACGPGLGSEPGFTWNWAQFLSVKHRVWVVAYPEHRASVEAHLAQNPNTNLRFVWVTSSHPLDRWKPENGERGIRIHYMFWLSKAYKRAAEVCHAEGIDLAHHISWGTVGAPPPFWRLPVPAIWGPIGGGQTTPAPFLPLFGPRRWAELVRTVRVKALLLSRKLRVTARDCSVVFATNPDTLNLLKRVGVTRVRLLIDCALAPSYVPDHLAPSAGAPHEFTLLWAGRLEYRKGLSLGLEALGRIGDSRVRLLVAGRGPQRGELEALAQKLGLAGRVTFLGGVPYQEMGELFKSASAFLFTSLRDSFGSVVLEAMAHGLPVVALNHQGIGSFVPDAASVKVPVTNPKQTIAALAEGIERLAGSPDRLQGMRSAAWNFAREQTWDRRAARMSELYAELIAGPGRPLAEADSSRRGKCA
jgi:glycosyltransferase involved in cell wall biosynthesis